MSSSDVSCHFLCPDHKMINNYVVVTFFRLLKLNDIQFVCFHCFPYIIIILNTQTQVTQQTAYTQIRLQSSR